MRNALILSPFATAPLDAGHRRRVFQTTQMLRDQGYRITFLLYAFEDSWAWKFQQDRFDALVAQWDEVIVYAGDGRTGARPRFGPDHQIDEWWNEAFGRSLDNLFARRFFDLFVVHNVWLSKAFDLAPRSTIKVLETHDLFSRRRPLLNAMGVASDFYMPDEMSELNGIGRADIAVTIQEEEARYLLGKCKSQVITVPFYDPALEAPERAPGRADYLSSHKVVFGFLGSAHIFNVRGFQALLDELEKLIGETFAPVDILAAGSAADSIRTCIPVRHLGRVPSEAEFYRQCDIAIAPTFCGTGFKIKVGDCLALRMPLLSARHSAIGTSLPAHLTFDTPAQMARAMVDIALNRPVLAVMAEEVNRARQDLKRRASLGMENFERLSRRIKTVAVMEARGLTLQTGLIALYSLMSCARAIGQERPVYLILDPQVSALIDPVLPPGVMALAPGPETDLLLARMPKIVVDIAGLGAEVPSLAKQDIHLTDKRWDWQQEADIDFDPSAAGLIMPYFHKYHRWEPSVDRLRKHWPRLHPEQAQLAEAADFLVFRDGNPTGATRKLISLPRKFLIIDVADHALVVAGLLHILAMPEESLDVICATALPGIRATVFAACQQAKQRLSSTVDGIFKSSFPAPPSTNPNPFGHHVSLDVFIGLRNADFIQACYQELLGKPADQQGLAHYLYEISRGTSREAIIGNLLKTKEAKSRNIVLLPSSKEAA